MSNIQRVADARNIEINPPAGNQLVLKILFFK